MHRTVAPADTAHHYPRRAKLSTLPASHAGQQLSMHPDPVINGGHDDVP